MYPPKELLKVWITALRTGYFKQTRADNPEEFGYCFLGVASSLFWPRNEPMPIWIRDFHYQFKNRHAMSLDDMNNKYSFEEIADILEDYYLKGGKCG